MNPNLPSIPRFYVDEKKRSKKTIFAISIISLLVLALPFGVYLVGQKTALFSQAATQTKTTPETSLRLSSTLQSVDVNQIFKVDVLLKSDFDEANLAVAKLRFTRDSLEIIRIDRSSTFAKQWIDYNFDNEQGTISLMAGSPNPGLKTTPTVNQFVLATLIVKAKQPDLANISIDEKSSAIFRNSDNKNILQKTNLLTINISENKASTLPQPDQDLPQKNETFDIYSPVGGKIYSYYQPIQISWDDKKIDRVIAISLYLNGQNFGRISSNIDSKENTYKWNPQDTLLLPYITATNTFQIGVTAINKEGKILLGFNDGPFGISASSGLLSVATSSAQFDDQKADLNGDGNIDSTDLSILFSNYNLQNPKNPKADINQDGQTGEIDFWIIRKLLIAQGLIRGQ